MPLYKLSPTLIALLAFTVKKRVAKGSHWHAKTFISSVAGVPRVGIIGSSNITRPAADTSSPFDYEADVVLWDDVSSHIDGAVAQEIANLNGDHGVIVTKYEPGGPNGSLSLAERLD